MHNLSPGRLRWISFSIVLTMLLYIGVLLFSLSKENVDEVLSQVPVTLYLYLLLLSIISYLLRFFRWYLFLSPINPSISTGRHLLIYLAGFAMATTPGKSGETIRSLYLSPLGIRYHQSLAAFFADRMLDVLAVMFLSTYIVIISFAQYRQWVLWSSIVIILLFLLLRSHLLSRMIERFIRHRSQIHLIAFQKEVKGFLSGKSLLYTLPISLASWSAQGLGLYLIVQALGFGIDPLSAISLYCISILAGAASFIPGGVGATETAITLLLSSMGMDLQLALVASVVCRGMTLWVAIVLGILSMALLGQKADRDVYASP